MERTRLEFHVETLREVLPRVGRGGEAALNGGSPTALTAYPTLVVMQYGRGIELSKRFKWI